MSTINRLHLIYFSPSGSTEKIVKKIAALAAFVSRHSMDMSIAAGRPDAKDEEIMREFGRKSWAKFSQEIMSFTLSQKLAGRIGRWAGRL